MKKSYFKVLLGTIGASAMLVSSASVASFSWSANGQQCGNGTGGTISCNRSETLSGETVNVEVIGYQTPNISSGLTTARVNVWDGLSVQSSGESYGDVPQHATDNSGNLEGILFSFDKAVNITSITMGWHQDSDFSLLRYIGNSTPINGTSTYDNMESNGWELVGNYLYGSSAQSGGDITASIYDDEDDEFDGPKGENTSIDLDPADTSSSYWLVAAMNDAFWGNSNYTSNDYFKLKSLVATYTPPSGGGGSVPEPSTLALMSISFLAFGFTLRRRRKELF